MSSKRDSAARGPRGRRPGQSETRQAILEAARARFAADGFTTTTIRAIAADAGVDAALVMQFFKSKDELFGAVMSVPPQALARMSEAWQGRQDEVGERVTRAFLEVWEGEPRTSEPLLAMLRGAITQQQAAAQLRDFIEARLMKGAPAHLQADDDTRLRVGLAAAMLVGIIVARRIVGVPTIADQSLEVIVARASGALQALLAPSDEAPILTDGEDV